MRKGINSPAGPDPLLVGVLPSDPNPVEPGRIVERVGVSEVEASGKEVAPNPPATAESWANPMEGGEEARKTEYTFFYESCFNLLYLQQMQGTHEERIPNHPRRVFTPRGNITSQSQIEDTAYTTGTPGPFRAKVHIGGADVPSFPSKCHCDRHF